MAEVGSAITYVDEVGVEHDALITARHDGKVDEPIDPRYSVNLLYLGNDPDKRDQYGVQLERAGSVQGEASGVTAHGRFWRE